MTELDPGRVLAAVARVAGVEVSRLLAPSAQERSPAPLARWLEDRLTTPRLAAVTLLREQGISHRAIARAMRRSASWVPLARRLAQRDPAVRDLVHRARAELHRPRPSDDEIAAILRKQREDAQAG